MFISSESCGDSVAGQLLIHDGSICVPNLAYRTGFLVLGCHWLYSQNLAWIRRVQEYGMIPLLHTPSHPFFCVLCLETPPLLMLGMHVTCLSYLAVFYSFCSQMHIFFAVMFMSIHTPKMSNRGDALQPNEYYDNV